MKSAITARVQNRILALAFFMLPIFSSSHADAKPTVEVAFVSTLR